MRNSRNFLERSACVLTTLLVLALPAGLLAEDAPRSVALFRSSVDLVNLTVTVTDGASHYVSGLAERDFQVLEDGVPQQLSMFTQERLPISLAILLDTSGSMAPKLAEAQAAALRFLHTLGPGDLAQVVGFDDKVRVLQEFTADRGALESAVRSTNARGGTALYNAIYISLKELDAQRRAGELRRRAMIVLTDGADTASVITDDQVRELARRTEIGIYGVSLRRSDDNRLDQEGPTPGRATFFLAAVSRETGGQAHFLRSVSELRGAYERVAEELRSQYCMGYVSSNPANDGGWRRVVVRTPDRSSLQVRHKLGYYASRD